MPHESELSESLSSTAAWLSGGAAALLGFVAVTVWVITTGGNDALDHAVATDVALHRSRDVLRAARVLTMLGSVPAVLLVGAGASVVLWYRARGLLLPLVLVSSIAAAGASVFLLKIAIGRVRPMIATRLGTPASDYSFPSGHTTDGTVLYVLAALLLAISLRSRSVRLVITGTGVVLAIGIGMTRVYLGYHWLTDVLGGWLLAASVICAAVYFTITEAPLPAPSSRRSDSGNGDRNEFRARGLR